MAETTHVTLHHLVEKRFVGTTPDGRQVLIDGTKEHPIGMGPMQLVLNAWGGCVAYDVVEMLKKRRVEVRSYRVELEGDRDGGVPAFYTRLRARHVIDAPGPRPQDLRALRRARHHQVLLGGGEPQGRAELRGRAGPRRGFLTRPC